MDFYEVIRTRRSIRSYKADAIPEEVLQRVMDAARIAQSGSNRQPWHYIIITDKERIKEMVPLCANQVFIAQAPVLIVACGMNLNTNRGGYMGDFGMLVDVSISFSQLTLAARVEDLGTCWIGSFNNDGLKKYLEIPDDVQVVALTPLGYPAESGAFFENATKKGMEEIVSYEKYK
ncbi:MAG: nitroreductase family protein [Deltaproteobacteria bacterium]|nr:nitroreductase family protein [Deltaproteobacteria bacterium]